MVVFTGSDSFPEETYESNSLIILTTITDEINVHLLLHDYKMCF